MRFAFSISLLFALAALARADEPPSFEDAAGKLQAATVTVRIIPNAEAEPAKEKEATAEGEAKAVKVSVCSGISLGGGLIVTHADVSQARIRVTLSGGAQAQARVRVFDQYSGLALLDVDQRDLAGLKLAETTPGVGAWVLSAAAWGAEKPVVSLGILSAAERTLPGATYPPLLQCDVRTADTSSGAGLVNRAGELVGIIVATDAAREPRGWTYAVPASHVNRLVRTRAQAKDDQLIVLSRRRPTAGAVLATSERADTVIVERIEKGGPAEKAGLQVGDHVLAVEGTNIRSVYEAFRPVLQKQPGDKYTLRVQRGGEVKTVEITLGGGVELPPSIAANKSLIKPTLDIESLAPGKYISKNSQGEVREVSVPPTGVAGEARVLTQAEQVQLLEKALDRYRAAIEYLQGELARSNTEQTRSAEQLRSLSTELESLKKQLDEARAKKE